MVLVFFILIFLLFRLPSLFEPYWYGDEAVYQVIGTALRQGRLLYAGIWDNKPPPLYLLYALFNGDQLSLRILSVILGIVCILIFYKISQKFFAKFSAQFISTLIFTVFLALPLFEANIANTEIFMLPLILGAVYLIIQEKNPLNLLFAGAFLSLAVLFKQVAIFELIGFSIYLIAQKSWKNLQNYLVGILIPGVLILFYLIANGIFLEFIKSVLSQNTGYVAGNLFGIPFAMPVFKLLAVSLATYFCLRFRKYFSKTELFILFWLVWSLMDILFTGMNFPHYLLLFSPALALLIGWSLENTKFKKYLVAAIIVLIIWLNFRFYIFRDIPGYYVNFTGFISGKISDTTYWQYFDPRVVRDYNIAAYLKSRPEITKVFIWGDNPQIYKLSGHLPPGRFTVAYHLRRTSDTLAETEAILRTDPPQIVVILEGMPTYPFSLDEYEYLTTIDLTRIFQRI